ncbi:PREDICTED: LOW QUALITY PROTEIN: zinc finger BED domain-containing protein 1 [Myotis brandtii]|uniref:LOW QUALITY PROTEIN: zinc finger BED domain-containing protein 1 n=1 Tax=Myotis brandtii TaxID=109478 RepID=UPI000703EA50|nr:PREDICTED: LOW QUALITY PROTEIN: zinc finger BED domain-containing protein 1 [Myotis brandtii]
MEAKTPPDPNAHPSSSSSPSSDLKLVAHPRAKSKVWKYFGFDTDAAGCILQWKKIYCRICRAQIAYSGNTSNLSYHLEKNHAEEFCELVKSNTEQMREAFATAFSKLKPPDTAGAAAQQQLTAQDTRHPVLVEDSNSHHLVLDAAEWAGIEALAGLLQPFKQVADMLCASRYPTISMVKPLLHMLLNTTLSAQELDSKEVSLAKELIAQELARTYQDAPEVDMFLNVATFLDPRYKKLPFLSALERQQVESRVLEEAKGLLEKMKEGGHQGAEEQLYGPPEEPPEKKPAPPCATAPCARTQPPPPPSSVINNMLAEIFCPQAGASEDQEERHAQVLEELSNFKSQKVLGLDEDPLKWWSERQALFPVLPKVLQKYWCVAEPEPEDEDEGEWGLDHEPVVTFGDAVNSGFFGGRDSGLV